MRSTNSATTSAGSWRVSSTICSNLIGTMKVYTGQDSDSTTASRASGRRDHGTGREQTSVSSDSLQATVHSRKLSEFASSRVLGGRYQGNFKDPLRHSLSVISALKPEIPKDFESASSTGSPFSGANSREGRA